MKKHVIKEFKHAKRIPRIAKFLKTKAQSDCGEHFFTFENDHGSGKFTGINFECGIDVLYIKSVFNLDVTFEFDMGRRHPVLFQFTKKGKVTLKAPEENVEEQLLPSEAIIFSPEGDSKYSITFEKDIEVNCIIIGVVRSLFLEKIRCELDSINNSISAMFDDTEGKEGFYHKTNTLPIGINKITHLLETPPTSIEKSLLVEASVLSLISSLVKNFLSSSNLNESAYWFSNEDLGKINQVKNYIIDNLNEKTTVSEFAKMVGMNENKLQKGFQLLFHKSIKQFMITMRMHKAMSLMDENNRTISEIAFEMGYTNISHFSDLFRREFGLLPSEYRSRVNASPGENGAGL